MVSALRFSEESLYVPAECNSNELPKVLGYFLTCLYVDSLIKSGTLVLVLREYVVKGMFASTTLIVQL